MMIQAVLSNPSHPEYGVATIPFPIPHDQYAHCMDLLEALEIGNAVKADCKVEKVDSFCTVLKRAEMLTATAPHRWLKTIENKFADALRIPSLCRCPQCGGNDRRSLRCVMTSTAEGRYPASSLRN